MRDGNLAKAASLVENAERAATEADEDAALNRVESQMKEHTLLATVSELGGQVKNLQNTIQTLMERLTQLERRPAPAPTVTVAKAVGGRRGAAVEYRDTVAGLATRLEAAFDEPGTVGTYSSMLQSKDPIQIEQVRMAIEAAELAHESKARRSR